MSSVDTITLVRNKFLTLLPVLDERMRRLWAANEARALGWGGIATVAEATGLSRTTIRVGLQELNSPDLKSPHDSQGVRRSGAGRPGLDEVDGTLREALKSLLLASTQKDPTTPLRWTCQSTRRLAQELAQQGHQVSHASLATLIRELGYRLQSTRGSATEKNRLNYNAQFLFVKQQVKAFIGLNRPVVAIETPRKMPHGDNKLIEKFDLEQVTTSFAESNKPACRGVWQQQSAPQDRVTFAVECLERWWFRTGINLYPYTREMLVITDHSSGGGTRFRPWQKALQSLAHSADLHIVTYSLPPGVYQWTQLTHTLYQQIIESWPDRFPCNQGVFISLMGDTTDLAQTNINDLSPLPNQRDYAVTEEDLVT
jgi:transposase